MANTKKHKSVRYQTYTKTIRDLEVFERVIAHYRERFSEDLSIADFLMKLVYQEDEWIKRGPRFSRNMRNYMMTKMLWSKMCSDMDLDVDEEWEKLIDEVEKLDKRE